MSPSMKLCTICQNAPQSPGVTRCVRCQGIFNAIRTKNPNALTKERRVAPTVNQLRAALGMPPRPAKPKLKSVGNGATRDSIPRDAEYEDALGYIRDYKAQQEGKQGYVYLIIEVNPGGGLRHGKVGYSTNPQARVAELQTGNPRPLALHALRKGTVEDEAAIHTRYIESNVLQEWFHITKELLLEFPLDENGRHLT